MAEVIQALSEVKELYAKVFGLPAPEIGPSSYVPFPPGVDPVRHAMEEVRQIKEIAPQLRPAPAPMTWTPRVDTFAARDGYLVRFEIPGVRRDSLKVLVTESECVVRGDRRPKENDDDLRALSLEWIHGPFERRIPLPVGCSPDKVVARYAEGVLELRFEVEPAAAPKERHIEIG
jgi:HSP20 family protein